MKKTLLIVLPLLLIFGCSKPKKPNLCDCIMKPVKKKYQAHCEDLMEKQFGPSLGYGQGQMAMYVENNCAYLK